MSLFPLSMSPVAAAFRCRRFRSSRPPRFRWSHSLPIAAQVLEQRLLLAAGDLDTAFGANGNGLVTTDFGDTIDDGFGLAVQPDGKIVVAGGSGPFGLGQPQSFTLARYEPNGGLDASFGSGGRVTTDFGSHAVAHDVHVVSDPAGNVSVIYAAGEVRNPVTFDTDFALAAYLPNGAPVPGFGEDVDGDGTPDGVVRTDFGAGEHDQAFALTVQSDGKIVLAGRSENNHGSRFAATRYHIDGTLDNTFSQDGRSTESLLGDGAGGRFDAAHDVLIHPDGRIGIVMVGPAAAPSSDSSEYVVLVNRPLNPNVVGQSRLRNFSALGIAGAGAAAVTLDSQGRFLVAGTVREFSPEINRFTERLAVARFNPDLRLDPTFGQDLSGDGHPDGLATVDFGISSEFDVNGDGVPDFIIPFVSRAVDLLVQLDGKIVVAGNVFPEGDTERSDFAVARFLPDGSGLDISFGQDFDGDGVPDGRLMTDFLPAYTSTHSFTIDAAAAVAIQGEKIIVAGTAHDDFHEDFALARYDNTITPPDTDNDGVPDHVEDGVDGNGDGVPDGDGDRDGSPDRDAAGTASLPNSVDGAYVTITLVDPADGTAELRNVAARVLAPPSDVTLPIGAFEFTIAGLTQPSATVEMIVHSGIDPAWRYFRFGPTPTAAGNDHWYEFVHDGTAGAQLVDINGDGTPDRIRLEYVDGGRGDDDLAANGTIVDPGGPAVVTGPPPEISGRKFHDVNGNGLRDTGEPSLPGWTINLHDHTGLVASTQTDANGQYSFNGLGRRDYRVSEELQAGWFPTTPPPFTSRELLDGPFSLGHVQTADLNDDGRSDLVALAVGSSVSKVEVFFGNGDGTFQAGQVYDTGLTAQEALAIADLDGQNGPDIVVAGGQLGQAAILLNNGDGTFGAAAVVDAPGHERVFDLAVADVNGASGPDLILMTQPQVFVLLNNGTGSFGGATQILNTGSSRAVVAADWDGDGDPDLAVSRGGVLEDVLIYRNDGGLFTQTQFFAGHGGASSLAAVNVDGDADFDLIAVNVSADSISVFLSNGSGTFAEDATYAVGDSPRAVTALDVDGDAVLDLAVANAHSNDVTVLRGLGNGSFRHLLTMPVGEAPRDVASADFDGDGFDDVAAALFIPDQVHVLLRDTMPAHVVNLGETPVVQNLNLGNRSLSEGEIRGHVFVDRNRDGMQQPAGVDATDPTDDEIGAQGAVIYLDLNDNGTIEFGIDHIVEADASGNYVFTNLAPGTYTVRRSLDADALQTLPLSGQHVITLGKDQKAFGFNFGYAPAPVILGTLWNDLDGDGDRAPGEPPLAGWRIELDFAHNGPGMDTFTVTDANGHYQFDLGFPLPGPGTYTVTQVFPEAFWAQSFPADGAGYTLDVLHGDVARTDFGVYQFGIVRGIVWQDTNGDGERDDPVDEPLVSGVTVYVDINRNGAFDPQEPSVQSGFSPYLLLPVPVGLREVGIVIPEGLTHTSPNVFSEPTYFVNVAPGDVLVDRDFGLAEPGGISGRKYVDMNDNVEFDEGEQVVGFPIYVDLNNNGNLDSGEPMDFTDAEGRFEFLRLPPGRYTVTDHRVQTLRSMNTELEPQAFGFSLAADERSILVGDPLAAQGIFDRFGAVELFDAESGDLVTVFLDSVLEIAQDPELYGLEEVPLEWLRTGFGFSLERTGFSRFGDSSFAVGAPFQPKLDVGPRTVLEVLEAGGVFRLVRSGDIPLEAVEYVRADVPGERENEHLGTSLSVAPLTGRLLVGAPGGEGAAFDFVGGLFPDHEPVELVNPTPHQFDDFGESVAWVSNQFLDIALIGDPADDSSGIVDSGGAYLMRLDFDNPIDETTHLVHPMPSHGANFGASVAGVGTHVVIGAPGDGSIVHRSGAVVIFGGDVFRDYGTLLREPLFSPNPDENGNFGFSLEPLGDRVLVGAPGERGVGTVYLFDVPTGELIRPFFSPEPLFDGQFGFSLATLGDDRVVIGQPSAGTAEPGAVFVFELGEQATVVAGEIRADVDFVDFQGDRDGIPSNIEDLVPALSDIRGDGNNDSIPDSDQVSVASLPNAVNGSYVTLVSSFDMRLVDVRAIDPASIGNLPPGVEFPLGLFEFTVEGVDPGRPASVRLIDHSGAALDSYYKFGPEPGDSSDHWYEFPFDGSTGFEPGSPIGNVPSYLLTFVNGGRGDHDGDANNSTIVDPGGPALVTRASLDVAGPNNAVRGQPLAFTFSAEPAGDYTYDVDWDGDGTVDESLAGSESLTVEHVYPEAGAFTLHVTAISTASGVAADAFHNVTIDVVSVIDGDLLVGGTSASDHIRFFRRPGARVSVRLNHDWFGPFDLAEDARLVAFGQAGNDHIAANGNVRRNVEFYGGPGHDHLVGGPGHDLLDGGPGNDLLFGEHGDDLLRGGPGHDIVFGGSGHDILLGEEGHDLLFGLSGRDLLIGGLGRDGLFGGSQEDILIGGMTLYDANQAALFAIREEWTSSHSRAERIANLTDGSGPDGANDGFFLRRNETVQDDGEPDLLAGGLALDWVFAEDLDLILFGRDDDDDD